MKKRIFSMLLVCCLFVTAFPAFSYCAEAAAVTMQTSESGIAFIKRLEGFTAHAYADGSQSSIGYGSKCDPADYPNGITEEEADALLREKLVTLEASLNRYMVSYGLTFSQYEFDALVSITYNLGTGWIASSYRFWTMAKAGLGNYSDNEIASALGVWCHVGSAVSTNLLQRRISEIRLFLYGDYAGTDSSNFKYVIFNGNGGSVDTDVMLFREGEAYGALATAERSGYHFAGWYTTKDGGTEVTKANTAASNLTLYARWSTTVISTETGNSVFSDVSTSDWYYDYVQELSQEGVISGFPDGMFRPEAMVTAGQALKLILLAAGYKAQEPTSGHWASGYLSTALSNGWIASGELPNLDAGISRAKIAKIAAEALSLTSSDAATPFSDTSDHYVLALYQAGIVAGSIDSATGKRLYHPDAVITRAEISKIVWEISQK